MIKLVTQEVFAAVTTLAGMALWGWIAARRTRLIEDQLKQNEDQLRRIHTASAILETAMRERRPGERHLRAVN